MFEHLGHAHCQRDIHDEPLGVETFHLMLSHREALGAIVPIFSGDVGVL